MASEHGYRQRVARERIEAALHRAGVPAALTRVEELAGGTFNTVLRLRCADGTRLILKAAPPAGTTLMRYETGLLETEALYYRLARGRAPVPEVVLAEPDLLIMTEPPGVPLSERRATGEIRRELGRHLAALHTMTGDGGFGYPAAGRPHGTWPDAFAAMLEALFADAADFGIALPRPARDLLAVAAPLDAVTGPVLVHFDLWDGNILTAGGRVTGLIDAERAFWGDPVADFASLALFGEIADDHDFLAGYREAGGVFGEAEAVRLRAYQTYLYLIMWIEGGPRRFTPEHAKERVERLRPFFARRDIYC